MTRASLSSGAGTPSSGPILPLAKLMDGEFMGRILQGKLFEMPVEVRECRTLYRRYKPGTNCIVHFSVRYLDESGDRSIDVVAKALSPEDFANVEEKLAAKRWSAPLGVRPFAVDQDLALILLPYPNDLEMQSLQELHDQKRVRRILREELAEFDPKEWRISDTKLRVDSIRFKPEKRALLRWRTRAKHLVRGERLDIDLYARIYARGGGESIADNMRRIHSLLDGQAGIEVPRVCSYLEQHDAVLVHALEGTRMEPADLHRVGASLARLHRLVDIDLPRRNWGDLIEEACDSVSLVETLDQELGDRARLLAKRVAVVGAAMAPHPYGFVHGDFHEEQVLVTSERVSILDFDRSFTGDSRFDLGNFRAQWLYTRGCRDLEQARAAEASLLEGYESAMPAGLDREALSIWTAYALIRAIASPFRTAQAGWRVEIARICNLCEAVLA